MAVRTIIEIPKTTSGAADPGAPSILTTLPPEIRNRIYEYLFKRDGPILLNDDQGRLDPWTRNYVTHSTHGGAEQQDSDGDFCQGFHGCVGLLLSCRQIYHEAVGILYGENMFLFSQALTNQLASACTWLASIGSHYQLLSRVRVDTKMYDEYQHMEYDLLPLLKLIWNHPDAKCDIAFTLSDCSLLEEGSFGFVRRHDPDSPTEFMNGLLCALGTNDALSLRQYAKYSCLISSITVYHYQDEDAYQGYVAYTEYGIRRSCPHPVREFHILNHGSEVRWKESLKWSLPFLPNTLLSNISAYVNATDASIVFDLDAKKARGYRVGLSGVNDSLRCDIDQIRTPKYDEVVIRMSAHEATTDFESFKALEELLGIERFARLVNPNERRNQQCPITMLLMVKLSTPKPPADLRINISRLLQMFRCKGADPAIDIQQFDGILCDTWPIMWHHVQAVVFFLLSDVLVQYPSKANQPFPQIWINGHGWVLRATYPATATSEEITIPCSYIIDDPDDIPRRYWNRRRDFEINGILKDFPPTYNDKFHIIGDSLASMWYCLKNYHGRDQWSVIVSERDQGF